mmetsp:Transcript_39707/g.73586  ORF Transcript_39707/g.73586 Transcript_39707/m.73586 type:complete len:1013 (+) Transcript_39707:68-3106(+)
MPAKKAKCKEEVSSGKKDMRTSEDVFNRMRWDSQWADQNCILGYEDRIEGPMEVTLSAFVPMSEGGCIPFHRVWYVRLDEEVLWDRRRRLDRVFNSGETELILAAKPPKYFDKVADRKAADETAAAVNQARATMQRLEDERAEAVERKQREKARKSSAKAKAKSQAAIADLCEAVQITVVGDGAPQCLSSKSLRIVTWNVLFDDHIEDPELLSQVRAPNIVKEICASEPDVVALQEVTPAVLEALHAQWQQPFWSVKLESDLAILSRHRITHAQSVILGPSKRSLVVELVVHGRRIALANVHLTSDRAGDAQVNKQDTRAGQAKTVRAALATVARTDDVIICGDFNEPNASGEEAAVACMDGLTDAWVKVHGDADPGYTFDPTKNHLADLQSLVKFPRRLDRLFAGALWRPAKASLMGLGGNASDHYGVVVDLVSESPLLSAPTNTSAVVVLPPESTWAKIDEIRQRFDPSFGRWMPHINMIYGFLAEEHFPVAAMAMEKVMRQHGPLEVRLDELAIFEHGRSASLVAIPSCGSEALRTLQADLGALFPACTDQARHDFNPHLTLGKFDTTEEAQRCREEVEPSWTPFTFIVDEVALIARSDDRPFSASFRLPAGSDLGGKDVKLLEVLETRTGTRAFPVGSAAILGSDRPADSDFDILLVGTDPREKVFQALEALKVTWSRRANAKFPILQLQVGNVQLDIQYAQTTSAQHPTHWPTSICDEGGCAAAALRDAHAIRSAILHARGLQGWQQYRDALLLVKEWAKLRGICSNALGYLGGFSWALLLANTALTEKDVAESAPALAEAMWKRFAAWEWSTCGVALGAIPEQKPSDALMFIPCPSEPDANSARNVTHTTLSVLRSEIQLAAEGCGLKCKPAFSEFLDEYTLFACCEVRREGLREQQQPLCAAWLEGRLLALVRSLDDVAGRPLKAGPCCWLVGIGSACSETSAAVQTRVTQACETFQRRVVDNGEWQGNIVISVVDAVAARSKIASPSMESTTSPFEPPARNRTR